MSATNGQGEAARSSWQRPDAPLGTLIFREGLLSAEQLEDALGDSVKRGKRLGQVLVERGLLEEAQVARILAKQKGLEYVDLREISIDHAAAALLSPEVAWLNHAIPVSVEEGVPLVAIEDPSDEDALASVAQSLGKTPRYAVATRTEILRALGRHFPGAEGGATLAPAPPTEFTGLRVAAPEPEPDAEADLVEAGAQLAEPEPGAHEPEPVAVEPEPVAVEAEPVPVEPEPEPVAEAVEPQFEPAEGEQVAPEPPAPVVEFAPLVSEAAPQAVEPPVGESQILTVAPEPAHPDVEPPAVESLPASPEPATAVVEMPSPAPAPSEPEPAPAPAAGSEPFVPAAPSEPVAVHEPTVDPEQPVAELRTADPAPPAPLVVAALDVAPRVPEPPAPLPPVAPAPEPVVVPEPVSFQAPAAPEPEPQPLQFAPPAGQPVAAVEPEAVTGPAVASPPAEQPQVAEALTPAVPADVPAPVGAPAGGPGHRVVVRMSDGEEIETERFPTPEKAKEAAKQLTREIATAEPGDWPELGGRFVRPELIVSVEILPV